MSVKEPNVLTAEEEAELQVHLRLGVENLQLNLTQGGLALDANPFLADVCMAKINSLGHQEKIPRSYDWENVIAMLKPNEEFVVFVEYSGMNNTGTPNISYQVALRIPDGIPQKASEIRQRNERFKSIVSSFRRAAFPESQVEFITPRETFVFLKKDWQQSQTSICITGTPSPKNQEKDKQHQTRDKEVRSFQSLNDVVETCVELGRGFRLAFVVMRVTDSEREEELHKQLMLRNIIHPLIKTSGQFGQSITDTKGGSDSTGYATGKNNTTGTNSTHNETIQSKPHVWASLGQGIKSFFGKNPETGMSSSNSTTTVNSTTWTTNETKTSTNTYSTAQGRNQSATHEFIDARLQLADERLERYSKTLVESRGTGGYRSAVFVFSDENDQEIISQSVRGVLSGSMSQDFPFQELPIHGSLRSVFASRQPIMTLVKDISPILSAEQACQMLLLPEAELPGLQLRRSVFLGRNSTFGPIYSKSMEKVSLGPTAFWQESESDVDIDIPSEDLQRHMLIAGASGSGKTQRAVEILNELSIPNTRIIIFETAKGVYRSKFNRNPNKPPIVYTFGDSRKADKHSRYRPLRINPFYFEQGSSLKRHIAVLSDALTELMPTEALIGPKMREALEACYINIGWDIERGRWLKKGDPKYPSSLDFVKEIRDIADKLEYSAEIKANYLGALDGRAKLFIGEIYQDLFSHEGNKSLDELFPPEQDVIIETEALPPSEINVPAFLFSILLNRIRERGLKNKQEAGNAEVQDRWLIVVEEAHNILNRELEQQKSAQESNGGRSLLKNTVKLLTEGRELGIGLIVIDQTPSKLARDVIANTGTKLVMRLEDGTEVEEMGKTLGLEKEAYYKLGLLVRGEAIVKAGYMTNPIKSSPYKKLSPGINDSDMRTKSPSYQEMRAILHLSYYDAVTDYQELIMLLSDVVCENLELAQFALKKYCLVEQKRMLQIDCKNWDEFQRFWDHDVYQYRKSQNSIRAGHLFQWLLFKHLEQSNSQTIGSEGLKLLLSDLSQITSISSTDIENMFRNLSKNRGVLFKRGWKKYHQLCSGDELKFLDALLFIHLDREEIVQTMTSCDAFLEKIEIFLNSLYANIEETEYSSKIFDTLYENVALKMAEKYQKDSIVDELLACLA